MRPIYHARPGAEACCAAISDDFGPGPGNRSDPAVSMGPQATAICRVSSGAISPGDKKAKRLSEANRSRGDNMNRLIPPLSGLLLVALVVPLIARDQKASISTTCVCFGLCDAAGKLLPKALRAKTPLVNGTSISSDFGMRIHPILEYWAMHWGVDIAAPSGTPIYTTGDGIIEQAGLNGGYGNFVLVRHSGSYATGYAHASLFAPGIHPGAHVKQGQVIAFVGSTGLSTGPHLHYEVLVKGWPVNPECGCASPTASHLRR